MVRGPQFSRRCLQAMAFDRNRAARAEIQCARAETWGERRFCGLELFQLEEPYLQHPSMMKVDHPLGWVEEKSLEKSVPGHPLPWLLKGQCPFWAKFGAPEAELT